MLSKLEWPRAEESNPPSRRSVGTRERWRTIRPRPRWSTGAINGTAVWPLLGALYPRFEGWADTPDEAKNRQDYHGFIREPVNRQKRRTFARAH